jgi:hypothetical protein
MAISWIVSGDVDEVRNVMDDYRALTREWVPYEARLHLNGSSDWYEIRGEKLQAPGAMSVSTLGMLEAFNEDEGEPAKRRTVRRARDELWRHLGEGSLEASGVDRDGRVSQIPPREWSYLDLASRSNGADHLVFSHSTAKTAYCDVTIPRTAILDCWAPINELPALRPEALGAELPMRRPRRRKEDAVCKAMAALFAAGVPAGLTDKQLLDEVNGWLRNQAISRVVVSITTLRRVINKN